MLAAAAAQIGQVVRHTSAVPQANTGPRPSELMRITSVEGSNTMSSHGFTTLRRATGNIRSAIRLGQQPEEIELPTEERTSCFANRGRGIIDPRSVFMQCWAVLISLLLLLTATVTPFEVAFLETGKINALFVLNRVVDVVFIVDLVLQFNLAFTTKSVSGATELVTSRPRIREQYLKGFFVVDLLSVLPFDVVGLLVDSASVSKLRILRVVRLFRLMKLRQATSTGTVIEHFLVITHGMRYSLLALGQLLVMTLMTAHWLACLWHLITVIQDKDAITWVDKYYCDGIKPCNVSVISRYCASLYFSVMTLTTIGYGDITPSTDAERWVSAFVSIIGASIYAYIIGVASGIVGVMNGNKLDLQETVDELNAYMVQEKLPQGTSIRIREYMTFLNKTTGQHTKSIALMDKLSSGLRNDIVDMSFATVLTNVSFLSSKSRTFISRLATLLECKTYAPGEMIAPMHSPASHIYFLTDGVANVNMIELKSAPYHFGEQVLMQSGKYNMTVRAVTYCTFLTLSHQDLWDVLATNKDEFKFMRREVAKMAFRRSVVSTLRGMGAEGVYACSEVRELERLQKKLCDYDTRLQELLAQSTKLHKELGAKLPAYQTFSSSMVNNADLRDGLSTLEKQHHQIVTSSQEELRAQQYKFWKSRRCLEHAITPTTSTIE